MHNPSFTPDSKHLQGNREFIPNLLRKHARDITGVIHIGGHLAQEYDLYVQCGINSIIFVEPQPDKFKCAQEYLADKCQLFNVALGDKEGTVKMFVSSNNGMSSSVLEPLLHLNLHPEVLFKETISVPITRLDQLPFNRNAFNCINIDVQGYELEVLKGGVQTLEKVKYIAAEVNREEVYKGCALIEEVDDFLKQFNFVRQDTWWHYSAWGEAFYVKVDNA